MTVLRGLARTLLGRTRSDDSADPRLTAFVRGLTLGALVGAAIAGSSLWSRRSRNNRGSNEPGPAR